MVVVAVVAAAVVVVAVVGGGAESNNEVAGIAENETEENNTQVGAAEKTKSTARVCHASMDSISEPAAVAQQNENTTALQSDPISISEPANNERAVAEYFEQTTALQSDG